MIECLFLIFCLPCLNCQNNLFRPFAQTKYELGILVAKAEIICSLLPPLYFSLSLSLSFSLSLCLSIYLSLPPFLSSRPSSLSVKTSKIGSFHTYIYSNIIIASTVESIWLFTFQTRISEEYIIQQTNIFSSHRLGRIITFLMVFNKVL